ncbi:MAG: hypothetical protein ACYSWW_03415 [Planctomycetota bacterium]
MADLMEKIGTDIPNGHFRKRHSLRPELRAAPDHRGPLTHSAILVPPNP